MNDAWALVRQAGQTLSEALRAVWAQAKAAVKKLNIDLSKISELSVTDLLSLRKAIDAEIGSRPASEDPAPEVPNTPTYTLSWDSGVCDTRKHGKPYIARIVGIADNKLDREFIGLPMSYGKKGAVQVAGTFTAKEGEILEAREGGSWKNEYRYFYVVRNGELINFADATEASKKMDVMKYMMGAISLEELTK